MRCERRAAAEIVCVYAEGGMEHIAFGRAVLEWIQGRATVLAVADAAGVETVAGIRGLGDG